MGLQDGNLCFPSRASHSRAVRSSDAVTTRVPSGLNAALRTASRMGFQDGNLFSRLRIPQPSRAGRQTPSPRACHRG